MVLKGDDAFNAYLEPVVPCRNMSTRACVDWPIGGSGKMEYRSEECPANDCFRHARELHETCDGFGCEDCNFRGSIKVRDR